MIIEVKGLIHLFSIFVHCLWVFFEIPAQFSVSFTNYHRPTVEVFISKLKQCSILVQHKVREIKTRHKHFTLFRPFFFLSLHNQHSAQTWKAWSQKLNWIASKMKPHPFSVLNSYLFPPFVGNTKTDLDKVLTTVCDSFIFSYVFEYGFSNFSQRQKQWQINIDSMSFCMFKFCSK